MSRGSFSTVGLVKCSCRFCCSLEESAVFGLSDCSTFRVRFGLRTISYSSSIKGHSVGEARAFSKTTWEIFVHLRVSGHEFIISFLFLFCLERCQIVFISAIFFSFFISSGLFHPCITFLLFLSCAGPVQIFCLPTTLVQCQKRIASLHILTN